MLPTALARIPLFILTHVRSHTTYCHGRTSFLAADPRLKFRGTPLITIAYYLYVSPCLVVLAVYRQNPANTFQNLIGAHLDLLKHGGQCRAGDLAALQDRSLLPIPNWRVILSFIEPRVHAHSSLSHISL